MNSDERQTSGNAHAPPPDIMTSVTGNTTVMMGSQLVTWISTFVLMLFLPRYLGSEDYGRLFLAISLSAVFQVLIDFGGNFYITKKVARERENTGLIFINAVALRIVLWLVSVVLIMAFAYVAGYHRDVVIILAIAALSLVWVGVTNIMKGCFQGHEIMKYSAHGTIADKVFVSIVGIVALLLGANAILFAIILALGSVLNFTVSLSRLKRITPVIPRVDTSYVKHMARESFTYFMWSLFGVIYYRVDAIMLSLMTAEEVLGWYGAAYRFFETLMFIPMIFTTALFPIFSRLWSRDDQTLSRTTQKSIELVMLAAFPIMIGGVAFSEQIISLFFGLAEYTPTVVVLQIFCIGLIVIYANFVLISLVVASDKQKKWLKVAFGAMLLNPILNWFLIPLTQQQFGNGGIGAAIATVVTEVFLLFMAIAILPKGILDRSRGLVILKGAAAGGVMILVLAVGSRLGLYWLITAGLSGLAYGGVLLMLRTFSVKELRAFRAATPFWKGQPASADIEE
jgi:O-antigen/teichoic acid export membrane protein